MAKLTELFDLQKIAGNERLTMIIRETDSRYSGLETIDDATMELVAAGVKTDTRDPNLGKENN